MEECHLNSTCCSTSEAGSFYAVKDIRRSNWREPFTIIRKNGSQSRLRTAETLNVAFVRGSVRALRLLGGAVFARCNLHVSTLVHEEVPMVGAAVQIRVPIHISLVRQKICVRELQAEI